MRTVFAAMAAFALLGGCASTRDGMGPPEAASIDPMSPLAAPGYLRMAGSSDLFEIQSSRVALDRSRSPDVRRFAQMMIDQHGRTTQDLMAAAQSGGFSPPPPMMLPPQRDAFERVRAAGPDFDAVFKREQISGHRQALQLHRDYAQSGDNPRLRDVATRIVPLIEDHLRRAEMLPDYAPPPPMRAPMRAGERG